MWSIKEYLTLLEATIVVFLIVVVDVVLVVDVIVILLLLVADSLLFSWGQQMFKLGSFRLPLLLLSFLLLMLWWLSI